MEATTEIHHTHLDVLVVDDDEMMAEYIALQLEARGCRVQVASSARMALDSFSDNIDLLVTDWQMPDVDGMELVRRVRQLRGKDAHLHVVMMTAREDAGARLQALQAGVDDFLFKPVDAVQLDLALETARRNRLLHRRLRRRNQLLSAAHDRTREALRVLRADLDAAATLHERLLPKADRLQGVRLEHIYSPAHTIGGDTMGTSNLGNGRTLFFLIDVSGHGVPAALDSFHLHHRLKQMRPDTPEALVTAVMHLNGEIAERPDDSYATMLCGLVDSAKREGWMVRAGHPPAMLLRGSRAEQMDQGGGVPLGLFSSAKFSAEHFSFNPKDRLVVYSDGLTDCVDRRGTSLGSDSLALLLQSCADYPLSQVVEEVERVLGLRNPEVALQDDVSLLAVEHSGWENDA